MRFIDGTPITLTIPKGFPGARRVLVGYELGPFAAINLSATLTLATPHEVATAACSQPPGFPPCKTTRQGDLENSRLVFWQAEGRSPFATLSLGEWTLVFFDRPDSERTRDIARSLAWSVDADGFVTLSSSDAALDFTSPDIWMRVLTMPKGAAFTAGEIIVTPGCREGDPSVFGPPDRFTCFGSAQVQVNRVDQSRDPLLFAGVQAR